MPTVCAAIDDQLNSASARARPASPIFAARTGSETTSVRACARSATNRSGSRGVPVPSLTWSIGTSRPVTPSSTTSGMPPVAVPTTATSQAILPGDPPHEHHRGAVRVDVEPAGQVPVLVAVPPGEVDPVVDDDDLGRV